MNKIIAVVMLIYLVSCSEKYGFIYDEQSKKPLEGVTVTDVNDSSKIYITKKDGMFSFSDCNNLIIEKSGYKTDTLEKYGCKPNGKCFDGHIFYMGKVNR
jgi:hypothetical protein